MQMINVRELKPHIFKSGGWWRVTTMPAPFSISNKLWAPAYVWVATRNSAEHKWWAAGKLQKTTSYD